MFVKALSIITNFGCDELCEYCIWKKHPLVHSHTTFDTFDWNKLEFILGTNNFDKLSISGGGDPLFNLNKNINFYDKLFELQAKYNFKLDIHTSKHLENYEFLKKFNKVVLHINKKCDLDKIYESYFSNQINIRFVVVLHDKQTMNDVQYYIDFAKVHPQLQFSFREVYLHNKPIDIDTMVDYIKQNENEYIKYILQDDYNIYFMPNNTITEKFI